MTNNSHEELRSCGLQDVPISMLEEGFSSVLGRSSALCDAEYGNRTDDGALVFHFFPPGYAANDRAEWPNWHDFRDRLEKAILESFSLEHIDANYVEELKSFYLIVKPAPQGPNVTALITRFFVKLEAES
jgi:hypothetical protein